MKLTHRLPAILFGLSVWTSSFANIVLQDIENQSPGVWGIDNSEDFIPHRTAIKVCKAENTIFVGFYLSQNNIDFYRKTFPDGRRKPIGFELDIHDLSKVFARSDLTSESRRPAGMSYDDNYMGDDDHTYTLAIKDPTRVAPNTWVFGKFKFSKHQDIASATFEVQAQLVGNVRTLRDEYSELYGKYGLIVRGEFAGWFAINEKSDGNDFFNIRKGEQPFYQSEFFKIGDRKVHQWSNPKENNGPFFDFIPYACDFGPDPYGVSGATSVPPADPESTTPPPPPATLPKLVTAGTSSSAPNLSVTVVIEKHDQSEDTNQQVPLGDLYCGIQTKNTTSVKIGSFQNKCILYDGLKAGNDSPITLSSKTVSSLDGGKKTTTHHSFTLKDPSYYTLYGCANTGSSPPKETKISDNCGTRTFLAYGVPDVKIEKVYIQGGTNTFLLGSSLTVVADLANSGDNFHAGKNRQMTVSAELSGCVPTQVADALEMSDDILTHGASGKTKIFTVTVPPTATPGICVVTIVADPKGELQQEPNREANRSNNSMAITFQAVEPPPPIPQIPVISVTKVTIVNGSHVYTTEKTDVSIEVKNSGGAASQAMTGRMFFTPVAGGQDTSIGTFSIEAIPAGGTTTGIIPDVLFSGSGEMTTTVCFDSIPKCWDGGNVYVDTVQSPPGGEDEDGSTIMRLYRGMMQ